MHFCFVSEKPRRAEEERWHGGIVHLSCQQSLQCQVNYISTWSGPEERNNCASWECQKDLIIIFGKATRSGSVMSLLRIALLIAFLDVRAFQMNGTSFLLWLSFFLGWFPAEPLVLPCPCFGITLHFTSVFTFSLLPSWLSFSIPAFLHSQQVLLSPGWR